jgi:hypothetical protein
MVRYDMSVFEMKPFAVILSPDLRGYSQRARKSAATRAAWSGKYPMIYQSWEKQGRLE